MSRQNVPGPPEHQDRGSGNDDANREESAIAGGTYADQARVNEAKRREKMREALSDTAVFVAKAAPYVIIIIAGIMGWHYLGPAKWAWLSEAQISRVETAIAGGAISVVALLMRRYVG